MRNIYGIIKSPHLTEKADRLQEVTGQIIVKVSPAANKVEIKEAVEKMFNVKVGKVRTTMMRGKEKRVGRHLGRTSDWKKAIVTLTEGKINFLEEL
jgi:large subunit ribosomal protein L23